jgi:imidazoleglycerol-phosphate dehydratase
LEDRVTRAATVERNTNETQIKLEVNLDAPLEAGIGTGHGFLDHMLDQIRRHGRMGLSVTAKGDLDVDVHHLAEDTGITLGMALLQALGDKKGLERYADAFVPMDETLAHVVLDLSGRAHLEFRPETLEVVGDANGFNIYHLREFLRGFCNHALVTMHVRLLNGREAHHVVEAIVKAFSRALYASTRVTHEALPSTKGRL